MYQDKQRISVRHLPVVLHDWSYYLTLEDDEIDAERGVITEEWRPAGHRNSGFKNRCSRYFSKIQNTPFGTLR